MNLLIIFTYLWLCLALSEVQEIQNFGNIRIGEGGKAFAGLGIFEPITVQYNSDTGGAINFQVHHYNDEHRLNYGPVDVSVGSANGEPLHVDVKPNGYGFTVSGSDEFHVRVFYDGEVLGDNPRVIPGPLEVVSEGEYRKRIGFVDTGPYPVTGTLKKPTATPTPSTTTSSSTRTPISFSTPPQVTPTLEGPLTLGYSDGTFSFADATVVVGNEPEITQDGATVSIRGENEILVVSGDSVTTSPDCSSFTVAGEAVSMIKLTRYQQPYVVSGSVVVPVRLPSCHSPSSSSSQTSASISKASELSSMISAPESLSASASHQSEWPLDELETEVYYLDPVMCERPSSSSSETSSSASSSISSEDQTSESTSSTSLTDVSSSSERPSTLTSRTTRDDEKTSTSTWKLDTPTGGIDIPIPIVGGVIAGLVPVPVLICPPFCPFPDPEDEDKTITPTEATTTGPDGETITLVYVPTSSTDNEEDGRSDDDAVPTHNGLGGQSDEFSQSEVVTGGVTSDETFEDHTTSFNDPGNGDSETSNFWGPSRSDDTNDISTRGSSSTLNYVHGTGYDSPASTAAAAHVSESFASSAFGESSSASSVEYSLETGAHSYEEPKSAANWTWGYEANFDKMLEGRSRVISDLSSFEKKDVKLSKRVPRRVEYIQPVSNPMGYCAGVRECENALAQYTDLNHLFFTNLENRQLPVFIVNQNGQNPGNACNTLRYLARIASPSTENPTAVGRGWAISHSGIIGTFTASRPWEVIDRSEVYVSLCSSIFSPAQGDYLTGWHVDEFPFNSINSEEHIDNTALLCVEGRENTSEGSQFKNFIAACGRYKRYVPSERGPRNRLAMDYTNQKDTEFVLLVNANGLDCSNFDVGDKYPDH
ncbi:hypothetical protein DICA2_E11980 [Diutina catenulata]